LLSHPGAKKTEEAALQSQDIRHLFRPRRSSVFYALIRWVPPPKSKKNICQQIQMGNERDFYRPAAA